MRLFYFCFYGLMQLSLLFMSGVRHRGVFHHNRRRLREQQRWIPGEVRLQQEWRGLSLRRGHRGHCLPGQLRLPIGWCTPGFDEQCSGEEVCGDGWPGLLRWDVQLVSASVIKLYISFCHCVKVLFSTWPVIVASFPKSEALISFRRPLQCFSHTCVFTLIKKYTNLNGFIRVFIIYSMHNTFFLLLEIK